MGKELEYTGVIGNISKSGDTVCIESIQHNGKEVTDHVWVSLIHNLKAHSKGTRVKFKGTAYTYTDSQDNRKHGLSKCKMYVVANKVYEEVLDTEHQNLKNRRRK